MSGKQSGDSGQTTAVQAEAQAQRQVPLRPRDAATLILVDRTQAQPRVLLGRRRADLKFMAGKFVFPGGRVDKADRTVVAADELAEHECQKLMIDMKGGGSPARARALALAAVRETYEEAGIIVGAPLKGEAPPEDEAWKGFFAQGFVPSLKPLTFFARAITPPGRPRRFDARFFCAEATAIAYRGTPPHDELSDLVWMTIEEARGLELPPITRVILEDLGDRLQAGPLGMKNAAVPYYFHRSGVSKRQLISLDGEASSA